MADGRDKVLEGVENDIKKNETDEVTQLDPEDLPILFGLWQLVPPGEPEQPPTESKIIRFMSHFFQYISMPITRLFYFSNQIEFRYTPPRWGYIILMTLILPVSLFCLNYYYLTDKIPTIPVKPPGSMPTKPKARPSSLPLSTYETIFQPYLFLLPERRSNSPQYQKKLDDYNKAMKPWNKYNATLTFRSDSIQYRTIIYMVCMWMTMFTLMIAFFLFPSLQNTPK